MSETSQELLPIPQRKDDDYARKVLDVGVSPDDLATLATADEKMKVFKKELVTCDRLVGDWGDCSKVAEDCRKLIEAAHQCVATGDFIGAHNRLWQVRQRLVQAWNSQRMKKWKVAAIFAWLIVALSGCCYILVWLHLLPGQAPDVAESNANVAALYSSFLFGAIGGIFDALSAWSKNCTEYTCELHHWPWYLGSPFLGAILGAVVFAVFLSGLLVTTGSGLTGNTTVEVPRNLLGNLTTNELNALANAASNSDLSARAALILVLAFVAGFKQITVTNYLERLANSLFAGRKE